VIIITIIILIITIIIIEIIGKETSAKRGSKHKLLGQKNEDKKGK
jgi:uncharacterized alpha/beta hydrolase family protein